MQRTPGRHSGAQHKQQVGEKTTHRGAEPFENGTLRAEMKQVALKHKG